MAPFPSLTSTWHDDTYPSIDPSRPGLSMAGKSVVITGGGVGIGAAIARSFAKAGAPRIALIGRREHALRESKAKVEAVSKTAEVLCVPVDISNAAEVDKAFKSISVAFGPLDVLVSNAAAFSGTSSLLEDPVDEWLTAMDVNVKGTLLVARAFIAAAKPTATIVNVSSAIAHMSASFFPGFSAYAVSKMAGTRVFDYVQADRPDLHVVSIHPGQVVTEMSEKVGMTTPIDQVELPADFTVWAASPEAQFLKGKLVWANWDVDELKQKSEEIKTTGLLTIGIEGWPFAK